MALTLLGVPRAARAQASPIREQSTSCEQPKPEWIFCDDFERDRFASYFEYNSQEGSFTRAANVGREGSFGMRARWKRGQVGAGELHLAVGRTPQAYMRAADAGTANYREIYWRVFVRYPEQWTGGAGVKMSRAFVFASPATFAQAMIVHVWSGLTGRATADYLILDPVRGTDASGAVLTTRYNDFSRFKWLGARRSQTAITSPAMLGRWHCVEAHVRLNDPEASNGEMTLWIGDRMEARARGLNFVGRFVEYGINAVYLENYWNNGSPAEQERHFDDFVVSTARIGCE